MVCMFALSTVIQCAIQSYYPLTNDTVVKENWDSLDSIVQYMYIHGIILLAVQLNMSISFVVLRSHRLIWLIEEFHPPTIILLPCTNQLKCFSQETIILKHTFQPLLESAMPVHPKVPPKVSTKVSSPSSTQVTTVHLLKSRRLVQKENKLA